MSFRALALGSALGLVLSMAPSCGGEPVADARCAPDNCSGCCDGEGVCLDGTSPHQCGASGGGCVTCSGSETCVSGACKRVDPPDAAHLGCVTANGIRVPGRSATNCGHDGEPCRTCPTGEYCADVDRDAATPFGGICERNPDPPEPDPPLPIGLPCTTDLECQEGGAYPYGFCRPEFLDDGGLSGWIGGVCLADCSSGDVCSPDGVCADDPDGSGRVCFEACARVVPPCSRSQVCVVQPMSDGGTTLPFCWQRCNNPGATCPAFQSCDADSGYCR